MRSTLLWVDAAVLGRRSISMEPGMRIGGMLAGSMPNEDESDDMRDSEGMSGDDGGAKPVTQSITRKRESLLGTEVVEWLLERLFNALLLNRSCRVAPGWLIRSVR